MLGRQAFEQRAWATAYRRLSTLDTHALDDDRPHRARHGRLHGGRPGGVRPGPEESYRRHVEAGSTLAAVRDTFWLGLLHNTAGDVAVGGGWVARARLLEDAAPDAVEHGYLAIHEMYRHIFAGEFAAALELAVQVAETGRRCRDANLVAMGLSSQGRLLIYGGRVREGLALLDEAMVGLADPDVSPILAGNVYCSMVEACQEIADYRRMAEWTTALTRWCRTQPELVPFTGQCAVHRAQIMRSRGALPEALEELALAITRYAAEGGTPAAGLALYERGEVLRVQGDLCRRGRRVRGGRGPGARPAARAVAALPLAKGHGRGRRDDRAPAAGGDAGAGASHRALPAAVEVFLAVGDVDAARCGGRGARAAGAGVRLRGAGRRRGRFARWGSVCPGVTAGRTVPPGRRRPCRTCGGRGSCGSTSARGTRRRGPGCGSAWPAGAGRRGLGAVRAGRRRADLRRHRRGAGRAEVERLLGRDLPDGLTARRSRCCGSWRPGRATRRSPATSFLSQKTVQRHLSNIFGKTG